MQSEEIGEYNLSGKEMGARAQTFLATQCPTDLLGLLIL